MEVRLLGQYTPKLNFVGRRAEANCIDADQKADDQLIRKKILSKEGLNFFANQNRIQAVLSAAKTFK